MAAFRPLRPTLIFLKIRYHFQSPLYDARAPREGGSTRSAGLEHYLIISSQKCDILELRHYLHTPCHNLGGQVSSTSNAECFQ